MLIRWGFSVVTTRQGLPTVQSVNNLVAGSDLDGKVDAPMPVTTVLAIFNETTRVFSFHR